MKMLQKWLCLLLTAVCVATCASAESQAQETAYTVDVAARHMSIQAASVGDDGAINMLVYCENEALKTQDVTMTLGDLPAAVTQVKAGRVDTAWMFIVDTAYVSTSKGEEPIKRTLEGLIANMRGSDVGAIVTTGAQESDIVLKPKDQMDEISRDTASSNENVTNLYETIGVALNVLRDVNTDHRVLVIIASGENTNQSGGAITQLRQSIDEIRATVYTIAFTDDAANDSVTEFGTLALCSVGGQAIAKPSNTNADAVLNPLVNNEALFFTISAQAPAQIADDGTIRLTDSTNMAATWYLTDEELALINQGKEASTPEPEATNEPQEETAEPEQEIQSEMTLWDNALFFAQNHAAAVGGGAAAVIALVVMLIVLLRKRRNAQDNEEASPGPPDDITPNPLDNHEEHKPQPTETDDTVRIRVTLKRADGQGEPVFAEFSNDTELTIGREGRLALTGDMKISREHLVLRYRNGRMMATDYSQNGTRVNGTTINRPLELHQQDRLTMGRTDFIISWQII